jgi:hypothetical protein
MGMDAYASRQAHIYQGITDFFKNQWSVSLSTAARSIIAREDDDDDDAADLDQLFGEGTCTLTLDVISVSYTDEDCSSRSLTSFLSRCGYPKYLVSRVLFLRRF